MPLQSTIALANTPENNSSNYSQATKELMERMPGFKGSLEKDTTGKLVSELDIYMKLQKN